MEQIEMVFCHHPGLTFAAISGWVFALFNLFLVWGYGLIIKAEVVHRPGISQVFEEEAEAWRQRELRNYLTSLT
jgi:hypothetical protein